MLRGADRWLWPYLRQRAHCAGEVKRVFIAIADHFEPFHKTDRAGALERMDRWLREYPQCIMQFRDSAGRAPRHTFFYPIEQYDAEVLAMLTELCMRTGSEVEVHLHHEGDSAESLRAKLKLGVKQFTEHGLLSRDATGCAQFCFVHGDWALANSHPQGVCCGVDDEIAVLRECGCVADFTFPSAPDPTQPRCINRIYYAMNGDGLKPTRENVVKESLQHLLIVQGVLGLNWSRRKWGVLPRLENSDLTLTNPPTVDRWRLWLERAPRAGRREDWAFVKLHSHGGTPRNSDLFLGQGMRDFHAMLAGETGIAFHYVTAREMLNVIHALEDGAVEFAPEMLEHCYAAPPVSRMID